MISRLFHQPSTIIHQRLLPLLLLATLLPSRASQPIPLGPLPPFWRYSAALGPFLESGYPLVEIPDYLTRGDFPYRKRPYSREVPFADHLSIVRLLGGCAKTASRKGDPASADLAYRDAHGKIQYRLDLLEPRLRPYLDNGYKNLTLVLDNVPWCFPAKPVLGSSLGQSAPPADPAEWRDFITALCRKLKVIVGPDAARRLRFRVGTENNGTARFDGSQARFERHYADTAAAVQSILPGAKFGPFNISGVSVAGLDRANVNAFRLAQFCFAQPPGHSPIPFDWVAYSRYYRPGTDPDDSAKVCRQVWDEFARRVPQLKGVSREIHEFGIAPWGELAKGQFPSAEPGALGAALTCQMMWRLRQAGIDRLWHWPVDDHFRDRGNRLLSLFTSQAWLLSVMDAMAGGNAFLFTPEAPSPAKTKYLMAASFKPGRALLMVSAYNTDASRHDPETVRFRIPATLLPAARNARFVSLTRQNSMYDGIRRQLAAAGLLNPDFVTRPDRLGSIREMAQGRPGEAFVGDHFQDYTTQWVQSLTLHPLDPAIGKIAPDPAGTLLTLHLSPPEVLVIDLR